jgi:6-phosphogluconolactonase
MKIEVIESDLFSSVVADELVKIIQQVLGTKSICNISLCGGSTPGEIYKALSMPIRSTLIDWKKVNLFLGDERFVALNDDKSNYHMVQKTLIENLLEDIPNVFPIDPNVPNVKIASENYAQIITSNVSLNKDNFPIFDIMLLGIGEDGHTASLFPNDIAVENKKDITVAVNHPTDGTQRVSLTMPSICAADRIIYLSKGKSKAEIVKKIFLGNDSILTYPSRLFTLCPDKTVVFLDNLAASNNF